jgi:hypothetical protein
MTDLRFELAGLVTCESGSLYRPVATMALWPPPSRIEVDGEDLVLTDERHASEGKPPNRYPGPGMLEEFVGLEHAPNHTIAAYARLWGVLDICTHGLPASHNPASLLTRLGERRSACFRQDREPIEAWRFFAAHARATLGVAAEIWRGRPGSAEDCHVLWSQHGLSGEMSREVAFQVEQVMDAVGYWLELGDVAPRFWWWGSTPPSITFESANGGLFGVLAMQIALAVVRTDGLAICSGCSIPYVPPRAPRNGRRRYCDACRRAKVPARDASRDYRRRRRIAAGSR